jgi:calcium-binding protein CML
MRIPEKCFEVFRVFARDGDGLISQLELGEGMKDMGMKITAEEAEHMVRQIPYQKKTLLSVAPDHSSSLFSYLFHILFFFFS